TFPLSALLSAKPNARTSLPWRADVNAALTNLPLESVPELAENDIKGAISSRLSWTGINEAPIIRADLHTAGVRVQTEPVELALVAKLDPNAKDVSIGSSMISSANTTVNLSMCGNGRARIRTKTVLPNVTRIGVVLRTEEVGPSDGPVVFRDKTTG